MLLPGSAGAILADGGADQDLPAWHFSTVFTGWGMDPFLFVVTVWVAGLYLFGVWTLHRRGDRWPIGRTFAFVVIGIGTLVLATQSGIGRYDTTLLSVHMVQHMLLSMVVPLAFALGAPITLALRTLPLKPKKWLLAVLHSKVARVLSFPPLTFVLYIVSPWALYFSGWYEASLRSDYIHQMMHLHLIMVGALFFWPLMGIDPVPGRVGYPFRVLLTVMTLPFHAFLGVTIMGAESLLGGNWYPDLHNGPMASWLPDPFDEQELAGGILWASGDLIGVIFFVVMFAQWVRSSMREAAREDRRLDLMEARQRRAGASAPPQADTGREPGTDPGTEQVTAPATGSGSMPG